MGEVWVLMSSCDAGAAPTAPSLAGAPHTLRTAPGDRGLYLPSPGMQPAAHDSQRRGGGGVAEARPSYSRARPTPGAVPAPERPVGSG